MAEHHVSQRLFAEFIGTALLVFIGAGSVPAILLLESGSKAPFSGADLGFISMAFGLIIVALVYTIGKVSGCHINPAVTFALAVTKRFPWREVPTYWAAQIAGGVAGAFAMWGSFGTRAVDLGYGFGVVHFDHATTAWGSAMLIEAIGTGILLFAILASSTRARPRAGRPGHRSRRRRDHHHRRPGHECITEPGARDRPALRHDDPRRSAQLDAAVPRVHPGEPGRRGARLLRVRLDGDPTEGRSPDQGSRHRARPRRRRRTRPIAVKERRWQLPRTS
jgi:glycerol uptake facilitator-like aquaporin